MSVAHLIGWLTSAYQHSTTFFHVQLTRHTWYNAQAQAGQGSLVDFLPYTHTFPSPLITHDPHYCKHALALERYALAHLMEHQSIVHITQIDQSALWCVRESMVNCWRLHAALDGSCISGLRCCVCVWRAKPDHRILHTNARCALQVIGTSCSF